MKTEYYIATVVSAYRRAIDAINDNKDPQTVISRAITELKYAENRETFGGFYDGHPTVSGHLYGVNGAGVNQNFIGVVTDYDEVNQIASVQVRNQLSSDDEIEVFGPKTQPEGFYPTQMKDSDGVDTNRFYKPMEVVSMHIPYPVSKDDFIRKIIK
jgi:putative protease